MFQSIYHKYLFFFCLLLTACSKQSMPDIEALPYKPVESSTWTLLSRTGDTLQNALFESPPSAVVNGMFKLADSEGLYQLYSTTNPSQPVTPKRFARIGHFFEEVAPAQETPSSPIILINKQGEATATLNQHARHNIRLAHNFSEGRALVYTENGKYGYINTEGRMVIPPVYDQAYDFNEGVAMVGNANKEGQMAYHFIDKRGDMRMAIQTENCILGTRFGCGLLPYKLLSTGNCCYMNHEESIVLRLPATIKEALTFHHNVAIIYTHSGVGLINTKGKMIIPPNYEKGCIIGSDRVMFRQNGKWELFDFKGNTVEKLLYDSLLINHTEELAVIQRIIPQKFVCETDKPETTSQVPPTQSAPRPKTNTTQTNKQATPTTVKHTESWTKISKENPFYHEAAKVLAGNLQESDATNRKTILNYVEHFRTSYTTKDIDFLEQLFSENALIIVGKVIQTSRQQADGYLLPHQVEYNVKSKKEYLDRLRQVFQANKRIDVKFTDFHIMRHPTQKGIYGVSMKQSYSSDLYSDEGYLFLLWDFRNETAPQIHVRTWQPYMMNEHLPLPESEVFNISNFNLQ